MEYLDREKGVLTPHAFIKINRYGAWNVNVANDMRSLAVLLLSIVIEFAQT